MIRKAVPNDCVRIADIYNSYVNKGMATMDQVKTENDILAWLSTYNNRAGIFVYGKENVQGWGILKHYSDREGYKYACEISIYVHENFQLAGIGQSLINFLLDFAQQKNFKHVTAKIFANNSKSVRFFKKNGFSTVGIQHQIGWVKNNWVDMVIMEKLI